MELQQKSYLFVISSLAVVIVLFAYLNIQQEQPEKVATENLGTCRSLVYNGEDRIDLLFLASEEDTKRFSDTILNTPPYNAHKNYFNVFFIPSSDYEPTCKDYKGIAILCDTKENIEVARRCPNDYIFVVKDYPSNIRSSAISNVISLNKNHEDSVVIHEFGHAFGNLAEEYTPANLPRGSKNCVSSCDKFASPTDSCDLECSKTNFYRSIRAGVMRTLITSDYGQYNINLIKKLLEKNKPSESAITGNQIAEYTGCENKHAVEITINNKESTAELSKEIINGCVQNNAGDGELCVNELCQPTTAFTDAQDTDSIAGEQFTPDKTNLYVETIIGQTATITLDGNEIARFNLQEAGATACNL